MIRASWCVTSARVPTGGCCLAGARPTRRTIRRDISEHIRRQIAEIYPALNKVEITHSWGGSVGITLSRRPFVREVMENVTSIGGFSGHGVMLSNYCGKLYADHVLGGSEDLEVMRKLKVGPFPGGDKLRKPLLFLALTWYSLRDRF